MGEEQPPSVGSTPSGQGEVRLTLADYLELHDKARDRVNWPALITAVAGGIATVVSAVALVLDRLGGGP